MTLEQRSSDNEVYFNNLPAPVRQMILSMQNNVGVVIGALEIRGRNEIYFQNKKVVGLPGDFTTTSQDTSAMIIETSPADDQPFVMRQVPQARPTRPATPKPVTAQPETNSAGEILFSSLPPEAQGYITNMLGKIDMEMTVAGKRLVIKKQQAFYGGRLVVMSQETKTSMTFDELPDWAKDAIQKCQARYEDTIQMQDSGRLVVSITSGPLQVSFNKIPVVNIP